jgi:alginate O-acetyltransferase complex protein AlgI
MQNTILLIGSCIFYAYWDLRFLLLLLSTTTTAYFLALRIQANPNEKIRSLLVNTGLSLTIGTLFLFKYFNFFIDSFTGFLNKFSLHPNVGTLNLIMPLGISFYTFRLISYLMDVYHQKFEARHSWIDFSTYVCFFPTVISGPIDRPKHLLPQLEKVRLFTCEQGTDGSKQILWGLFKKMVIADNIAALTNPVFDNYRSFPGSALLVAAFFYGIQLYADFSGYSDMAIGTAKLLGLKVAPNFNYPFFSQNIAEFWRKWHISLTSWLTDYVFTPLSIKFRDWGKTGLVLAIVVNFTLCGLWHGANWTYVLFGFLHGLYFIPLIINGTLTKKSKPSDKALPTIKEFIKMAALFVLVCLTWIIFRANNVGQAWVIFSKICSRSFFAIPRFAGKGFYGDTKTLIVLVVVFLLVEWRGRKAEYALTGFVVTYKKSLRYAFYYLVLFSLLLFHTHPQEFVYFKF